MGRWPPLYGNHNDNDDDGGSMKSGSKTGSRSGYGSFFLASFLDARKKHPKTIIGHEPKEKKIGHKVEIFTLL
ncbi:hypothetical protein DERF_001056 [Dermatophagoides farinae]|uniref:Uncharacterized protein n=1 Tax=Dermatophagoides farinae TaxID=6954 RepID=A0A922LAT1_DERFA|nr:hypothetical protein DERF_001056 [Dermatophagoides farinae]